MNAVMVETPKEAARRLADAVLRQGYKPTALHEYRLADGSPWCWRIRCEHETRDKWIRPMRYTGTGYELGEPPAPANGKPLYRLPELLAADPAAPVWIVEGETCADRLARLGLVVTTSGSSASATDADWTPLQGRSAILWPDRDKAGTDYADAVAACLRALGTPCERLDVDALGLPDKGDAVDWLADHPDATAADVLALPFTRARFPKLAEPLPDPLPAVPDFDPGLLPASIRAWCEDAADGLQVPLDFTAIPAMVALAGALGRSVAVAMKQHGRWYERPVLWGCIVGRPSSGKSPALSPARRMLERLADEERQQHDNELREHQARALVAEATKANAKNAMRAAIKKGNNGEAEALAESMLLEDEPPSEPRLLVNDATVEKLGELLNANPRGLVQYRDELAGWLASLDRDGREGDRAFWLECWNGHGGFTVDRIGRGTVRIEACAVSILGGMQPGKLAEYVRGAIRGGFSDDGLMQRFQLAVYPDLPATWAYSDRPLNPTAEASAWASFQRLRALDVASIGAEHDPACDVPFLRLGDEALGLLIEWQTELMQRLRTGNEPAWMESHLSKYPGLVGRLALVLHLADGGAGAIPADTLARALDWCGYLEAHARRIYAPAMDGGLSAAHALLRRRSELGESFTARDVYRRGWSGLTDADTVAEALDVLAEYRHLAASTVETGGRPSLAYAWTSP